MARFDGSRHRINRAFMHAETFRQKANTLIEGNHPTFEFDFQHDGQSGGIGIVRAEFAKPFDRTLPLELGEFFYQLRAALDGAFWEAALIVLKGEIPSNPNKVEFPICATERRFKSSALHEIPFPDELHKFICSIQPYRVSEYAGTKEAGFIDTLRLIHDCARFDRHRELQVVAALPSAGKANFVSIAPCRVTYIENLPANFLENKCEFLRFGIEGWDGAGEPYVTLHGYMDIEVSVKEFPSTMNIGECLQVLRVTDDLYRRENRRGVPLRFLGAH